MRGLSQGHSYIVTSNAEPVGELRPLRRRRFVDAGLLSALFERAPSLEADRFRTDLDAALDDDITPRG